MMNPIGNELVGRYRERDLRNAAEHARRLAEHQDDHGRQDASTPRRPVRKDR
jgi:hypothetical protein